ncbi:MAG: nodulation protein NfeD [Thermoplasmata archaeon]|nr:nodulation protein NfeD [Thermoplasmata archaeon]
MGAGARGFYRSFVVVLVFLVMGFVLHATASTNSQPSAAPTGLLIVTFNIQVDPGASDYVHRATVQAVAEGKDIVIVMNTPGGLLVNMQEIVSSIGQAQHGGRHVYTFVPPNDFAASAGSYIALASDAVYLASGSIIGPSAPVVVGGSPEAQQHVAGAMLGYIESLAQSHGYNVSAAADMVLNNTAYSADRAAAVGLVTGRAESLDEVLAKLNLGTVPRLNFDEPFYDGFLSFLSDPTVDGLFILVGIIALVLDLFHRTVFLSVVAAIFIALGFLGAQIIGASVVGILILIIAAALVILEVKAGHGLFAVTGIALGLAGTYLLAYNVAYSPSPYGITQYVILGGTGAALVVAFLYLTRIRHALMAQPKLIDPGKIVNMTGRATTDLVPGKDGVANVGAEDWTALSDQFIEKGSLIRVTGYADGKIQVTIASGSTPASSSSNEPSTAPPSSP